ncbi:Extra-large guanine nucleotide-binding protein 1-like protein [Drosera capensis]
MSEARKVRIVHCPKCRKLLPEHPGLSVYQCGGCGALLQAKEKTKSRSILSTLVSARSSDEMNGGDFGSHAPNEGDMRSVHGKLADMMSKSKWRLRNHDTSDASVSPGGSRNGAIGGGYGLSDPDETTRSSACSVEGIARKMKETTLDGVRGTSEDQRSSVGGGRCESPDHDCNVSDCNVRDRVGPWVNRIGGKEEADARLMGRQKESKDEGLAELGGSEFRTMQVTARADQVGIDAQSMFRDHGLGNVHTVARSQRQAVSSHRAVQRYGDEDSRLGSLYGDPRTFHDYRTNASYNDVGHSSYHPHTSYGYEKLRHSFQGSRGTDRVSDLELERAQCLQRYHELKDQLSRSGDISHVKGISSPRLLAEPGDCILEERFGIKSGLPSLPTPRNHVTCSYVDYEHRSIPFKYDDPYLPRLGMTPRPHQYSQPELAHDYATVQSMGGLDPDPYELNHRRRFFHHPTCSCLYCHISCRQAHKTASSRSLQTILPDQVYTRHGSYGPVGHDHRLADIPAREPFNVNWLNECGSYASECTKLRPRRLLVADLNKQHCAPIAGGAPFILCCNCLELLKLSPKLMRRDKNRRSLQCGACFTRMTVNVENTISITPMENQGSSSSANNNSTELSNHDDIRSSHDSGASSSMKIESYDFEQNGLGFQSIEPQPNEQSQRGRQDSNGAESRKGLAPASSHSSRDVPRRDKVLLQSNMVNSADVPMKIDLVRPPPGSSLQEHFEYSLVLRKLEAAKDMKGEEQAKRLSVDARHQSPAQTSGTATEIDVNSSEFTKNSTSEDSAEVSRGGQAGARTGSQSSSSAYVKSFLDSNGSKGLGSLGEKEVYVNGKLIPPRELRRAQKQAGPIAPGCYWYDSKAGFWGVIGSHCLGIIPPFIQEFSFPMPVNCAGGTTAVYVNGRELHVSDLELLGSRGLPTTKDKHYIVEISGKVFDDTGELVARIGKLAPTVEKKKRGFGMRGPDGFGVHA